MVEPGEPHADRDRVEICVHVGDGATLALDPCRSRYVAGRSSRADIRVDDDLSVSREHVQFVLLDGHWYVDDLRSRNGSRVDGRLITGPVALRHGMVIRCGGTLLRVSWPAAERPRPSSTQPATVDAGAVPHLSASDRETLAELCRSADSAAAVRSRAYRLPSNEDVAERLGLSDDALRQRLKRLYAKFALGGNDAGKRRELIARTLESGVLDAPRSP